MANYWKARNEVVSAHGNLAAGAVAECRRLADLVRHRINAGLYACGQESGFVDLAEYLQAQLYEDREGIYIVFRLPGDCKELESVARAVSPEWAQTWAQFFAFDCRAYVQLGDEIHGELFQACRDAHDFQEVADDHIGVFAGAERPDD